MWFVSPPLDNPLKDKQTSLLTRWVTSATGSGQGPDSDNMPLLSDQPPVNRGSRSRAQYSGGERECSGLYPVPWPNVTKHSARTRICSGSSRALPPGKFHVLLLYPTTLALSVIRQSKTTRKVAPIPKKQKTLNLTQFPLLGCFFWALLKPSFWHKKTAAFLWSHTRKSMENSRSVRHLYSSLSGTPSHPVHSALCACLASLLFWTLKPGWLPFLT